MTTGSLRILRSCFSRSWGGLELTALETTLELQQRGHRVWLACPPGSRLEEEALRESIATFPLTVTGYAHPLLAVRLARFLHHTAIELIHTELSKDLATLIAGMRLSGRRIPLLLTKQMGSYVMKRDLLHRLTYAHVSRVLAISTVIRKNVIDTTPMPPERVLLLHHAVDTERFSPEHVHGRGVRKELGLPEDALVIGFVGRFSPGKGHEELLEAAADLRPRYPAIRLVIVGEASYGEKPYEERIRHIVRARGLGDIVTFAGFRHDIPALMASFDIFAFPSHAEAFGIVLIEAMAMERPVVSTNCDGILDIVVDGVTGIMVHPRNTRELAEGLSRLLASPALRTQLGKAGRERVLEHFDREARMDRLEAIYREVLEEHRTDRARQKTPAHTTPP